MKIKFPFFILILFFFSCQTDNQSLEQALSLSGTNQKELRKVLDHFTSDPADSLKYKAACFLIENMIYHYSYDFSLSGKYYAALDSLLLPEKMTGEYRKDVNMKIMETEYSIDPNTIRIKKDTEHITADFLIEHINQAFEVKKYPWNQNLSFEDFCEYILPYRLAREPLESWMPFYRTALEHKVDSLIQAGATDSLVCETFRLHFLDPWSWFLYSFRLDFPPTSFLNRKAGSCYELAMFTGYTLRALGIPVAWEFTPQWANRSKGHDWNLVMLKNGNHLPFQFGDDVPVGEHLQAKPLDKMPKVFRKMYGIQKESLAMQDLKEPIPVLFQDPYLKDVSDVYFDPVDVTPELTIPPPAKKQVAYIMVFDNVKWRPVHWGWIKGKEVTFTRMAGGCMYIAMYYHNEKYYPASEPFVLSEDGSIHYKKADPEKTQTVRLFSRYPDFSITPHNRKVLNAVFQGADHPEFIDPELLHKITAVPQSTYQHVPVINRKKFRYVRYLADKGSYGNIAEIEFYTTNGTDKIKLLGNILGTDSSAWNNPATTKEKVFDGDRFSFFDAPVADSAWVGLDLGKPYEIVEIRYLPRHPDHHIHDGFEYDLFYWDKDWISLGKKTGGEYELLYENVPGNALLLLHTYTLREEERIFTYENGEQIWW